MLAMSLPMMTSCNDLFDDAPINQITEGTVWTNSMQLDQYVNTWYRNMNNGFNHFIFTMSVQSGVMSVTTYPLLAPLSDFSAV